MYIDPIIHMVIDPPLCFFFNHVSQEQVNYYGIINIDPTQQGVMLYYSQTPIV
jgi:hypothetical protein